MEALIDRWGATGSDSFRLRARTENDNFLLCHQTDWQRRLLCMYGSMTLLDATYRTTKYSMPLFFLCVRTNVCYTIVGSFITQREDAASIQEALEIFKAWNPTWEPASFIVDFSLAEINAIESVWPGELKQLILVITPKM